MSIEEYAKKSKLEQAIIIREHAIYIDKYKDDDKTVFIYYFNGYFIEAVTKIGVIMDVIPFRKYNINKAKLDDILKRYGGGKLAA